MSLWTTIRDKVIRPAIGAVANTYMPGSGAVFTPKASSPGPTSLSFQFPATSGTQLASLPRITSGVRSLAPVGAGAVAVARGGMVLARTAARSASVYCRRHPAWCATLGIGGVAALVEQGQLPPIKRRRARGITGTELKNFRRVSQVLNKWCKTPPPTKPRRSARSCS